MNNKKKNVHTSGPLGMLVQRGQVRKVDYDEPVDLKSKPKKETKNPYFKTEDGIKFNEKELVFVEPADCTPWEYANRLSDEMGDLEELIKSIKENGQLQPALVKIRDIQISETQPKYEIVFGRRRHLACLKLGIPFLVIKKESLNVQDAIAYQDAENKLRKDVSNYSNALLYKKLIEDKIFPSQKELAEKLMISPVTLNELMAYSRIPNEVVSRIQNVHSLSVSMTLKILELFNKSSSYREALLLVAPEIGKTIKSTVKLEKAVKQATPDGEQKTFDKAIFIKDEDGQKLFTFKLDQRGSPCITINKQVFCLIDHEELCNHLKEYIKAAKANSAGIRISE